MLRTELSPSMEYNGSNSPDILHPGHSAFLKIILTSVSGMVNTDWWPICWYSVWTPPPQLPGNSQAGLAHYKRGCLPPPPSLTLLFLLLSLASCSLAPHLSPFPSSLSPRGHGWSLLLYSLLLSATTILLTPLPMP